MKTLRSKIVAWWSGGITSAVACYWAVRTFIDVDVVFLDTKNEDDDTNRFLRDCENLYGRTIQRLSNTKFKDIQEVWFKYGYLNNATGAICSTVLKREMREEYQRIYRPYGQVFGFDCNEVKRHLNMRRNYPEANVTSPLVDLRWSKADCARFMKGFGIEMPHAYRLGFNNNNCLKTGCVRGGIGYWKKYQEVFPEWPQGLFNYVLQKVRYASKLNDRRWPTG
jgi:3'-phosphoadenosine 5'-phosphosulfate sulfotransferase (PAPS reductase)/FAD synthetase